LVRDSVNKFIQITSGPTLEDDDARQFEDQQARLFNPCLLLSTHFYFLIYLFFNVPSWPQGNV